MRVFIVMKAKKAAKRKAAEAKSKSKPEPRKTLKFFNSSINRANFKD